MSLLMKALEKAARDRNEARQTEVAAAPPPSPAPEPSAIRLEPAPASSDSPPGAAPIPVPGNELALEPLPPRPSPAQAESKAPPAARPEPSPRGPALEPPSRPIPKPTPEQDRAATVLQASSRPAAGVGVYIKDRPLMVFAGIAALFAIGFGVYLYLQIFHPAFFIRQAPRPAPPLARAPAPVVPAPAPAPTSEPPLPLPTAPLLREPERREASAVRTPRQAAPVRPPLTAAAAPAPPAEPAAARSRIVVSAGSPAPRVDPLLAEAYAELAADRVAAAGALYGRLLKSDPRSIDALLGLAAVAVRQGKGEDAVQHYMKVLELDPRNAVAQSNLIALLGRADPLAAESRLQQLIAREPSAHLYFVLGNLYAEQSQWSQAQHAYFQAYHLEPSNPDYAYNLAVGLEHVSQPKLALGFYQRAIALAPRRPHVNFDLTRVQERVSQLAAAAN